MLEMPPFFDRCVLYYGASLDHGKPFQDFLNGLHITNHLDLFKEEIEMDIEVPQPVAVGTQFNIFDIPRMSKNDSLGELSFIVVGPGEVNYSHDGDSRVFTWCARMEFNHTNLKPGEIKAFLDEWFKELNHFTKDDLRRASGEREL